MAITDYVLGRFAKDEQEMIKTAVDRSADACEEWIKNTLFTSNEYL